MRVIQSFFLCFFLALVPFKWNSFVLHRLHIAIRRCMCLCMYVSWFQSCLLELVWVCAYWLIRPFCSALIIRIPISNCIAVCNCKRPKKCINRRHEIILCGMSTRSHSIFHIKCAANTELSFQTILQLDDHQTAVIEISLSKCVSTCFFWNLPNSSINITKMLKIDL